MDKPQFVYVTYIRSTPEKVWDAITNPEFSRQYWAVNSGLVMAAHTSFGVERM